MPTNLRVELRYPEGPDREEHYSAHARRINAPQRDGVNPTRIMIYGRPIYEQHLVQYCHNAVPDVRVDVIYV